MLNLALKLLISLKILFHNNTKKFLSITKIIYNLTLLVFETKMYYNAERMNKANRFSRNREPRLK